MTPTSGTGVGTPITGGAGAGTSLARPLPSTLLSLDRYAKIMGIPPAHFWGAYAASISPQVFPVECGAIWMQYPWQNADRVSRLELAEAIQVAEYDLAKAIGFWPGPVWTENERVPYPRPYLREYVGRGRDIRTFMKSVEVQWKNVLSIGSRALTLINR